MRLSPRLAALWITLLLAGPVAAESFSGSIGFGTSTNLQGELWFTALDPGDTSSSFGPFTGYSQASSLDYTYLYYLQNDSEAGTMTSFCDEHCFIGIDLETVFDPTAGAVHSVGHDASNGGEEPSFSGTFSSPDLVFYEFDLEPNYGILPEGGFSALLRFSSHLAPGSLGGAFITNNEGPPDDFVHITTGVTTPVPEPGTALLLGVGLLGIAARARRRG